MRRIDALYSKTHGPSRLTIDSCPQLSFKTPFERRLPMSYFIIALMLIVTAEMWRTDIEAAETTAVAYPDHAQWLAEQLK